MMTAESAISWAASVPVSTGTVRIAAWILRSAVQACSWGRGQPQVSRGSSLVGNSSRTVRLGRPGRPLQDELGGAAAGLAGRHGDAAQRRVG